MLHSSRASHSRELLRALLLCSQISLLLLPRTSWRPSLQLVQRSLQKRLKRTFPHSSLRLLLALRNPSRSRWRTLSMDEHCAW